MREIKFRAWDKINKQILNDEFLFQHFDYADFFEEKYILLQYTGLKDKNGKEIYEGDIVKQIAELGTDLSGDVIYNEKSGAFLVRGCLEFQKNIEVIGNIYENPELIK